MSYKVGGTALNLQPSTGQWMPRELIGYDGNGRPIYGSLRKYELKWDLISQADFVQLVDFFNAVGATGSLVIDLPKWGSSTGGFFSYTGCYISEPEQDTFFEYHMTNATLLVTNIRT